MSYQAPGSTSTVKVAILLGRRHRGESVKTGQEQGVAIDDHMIANLISARIQRLKPSDPAFATSAL